MVADGCWPFVFVCGKVMACCADGILTGDIGGRLCIQCVPRSEHSLGCKNSQLMLYREIMAVCSEMHTKHINTGCGQNVELLNVKLAVHIVITGL